MAKNINTLETKAADGNEKFVIIDTSDTIGDPKTKLVASSEISKTGHTHTASEITDFDTEVSNNAAVANNTLKNSYPSADSIKLAGIEENATADQTGAEIKALYEGEADTNAFTDAEKTKLSGLTDTSFSIYPGVGLVAESLGQEDETSTSYVKKKDIEVVFAGTYRLHREMMSLSGSSENVYSRVYVDDVADSAEYLLDAGFSDGFSEYSYDVTVAAGQNIQIYARAAAGGVRIKNFKIKASTLPDSVTGTVVL